MSKFKVGDRVISIKAVGRAGVIGAIGEIVEIDNDKQPYLVKFDQDIGSHDVCARQGGWWCKPSEIKLVKENNMFTKKDLMNGDVVKFKNGSIGIAIPLTKAIVFPHGQLNIDLLTDDMLYNCNHEYDIEAIRRPNRYNECSYYAFERYNEYGTLVYERKEVEEMTLEEVCKALGKEIKIVKK